MRSPSPAQSFLSKRWVGLTFISAASLLQLLEEQAHLFALEVLLRAAKIAREDREALRRRVGRDVALGAVDEWPDHDVLSVVGEELGRHRLELSRKREVEEQRDQRVVTVMAERDLVAAHLLRERVEDPASEAGAEGAVGLALGDLGGDDAVRVLLNEPERVPARGHEIDEHVRRVARVALIDVDRCHSELHGRPGRERREQVVQRVAVLAPGDRTEDVVSLLDQREIRDGATHRTHELLLEVRLGDARSVAHQLSE
jgi:hypothetical protein